MKSTRAEVYNAIDTERDYQLAMTVAAHGDPSFDYTKSLETFESYIRHYSNKLNEQLATTWGPTAYDKPRETLRKIAALAVAAMEVHGAVPRTAPTQHEGVSLPGAKS